MTELSVFEQIGKERDKLVEAKKYPLEVPGWGEGSSPRITVIYKPCKWEDVEGVRQKVLEAKKKERGEKSMDANALVLVSNCIGIEITTQDGTVYKQDADGKPLHFGSDEIAAVAGVQDRRAVSVCRGLFLTDGDLLNHANSLASWSGIENRDLEVDYQGE